MGQPVRNNIKELHPELTNKPFYTLIVDGSNLLKISMIDTKVNSEGVHYGGIFQFLLQLRILLTMDYKYDYVYIVFDDSDSGILRYQIYNEYKANRDKNYAKHLMADEETDYWKRLNQTLKCMNKAIHKKEQKRKRQNEKCLSDEDFQNVQLKKMTKEIENENFERERNILMMYCIEMSMRVLFDDKTEGDDFIAYYVANKKPEERIVIVSTDQDLTQLISPTVAVYNRNLKKYLNIKNFQKIKGYPVENVLLKKIFCGDASDNIGNIKGLSEARLMELMPEIAERPVTIEEVKERAQKMIDERVLSKKKPLQWHENIVKGISNKEYEGDFYEINEKIINLKKPLLTKKAESDIEAMMYAPMEPDDNAFTNLYQMIVNDNIQDLIDPNAFSRFFVPFKELSDREKQRYFKEISET